MFAFDAGSCDVAHLRKVPRANRPTTLTKRPFAGLILAVKTGRSYSSQI
jgi:hypothetical protein